MSDIMRPIPFDSLMDWILNEYRSQGTIFGIPKGLCKYPWLLAR